MNIKGYTKYIILTIVVILWGGSIFSPAHATEFGKLLPTNPPKIIADIGFVDKKGNLKRISDFRGKLIVLNFWATWCAPCVKEMPALNRLQGKIKDQFVVIALAQDAKAAKAEEFLHKKGLHNLALYHDPKSSAMRKLGIQSLPTTLVLNENGQEIARLYGSAEWDSKEILRQLTKMVYAPTQ